MSKNCLKCEEKDKRIKELEIEISYINRELQILEKFLPILDSKLDKIEKVSEDMNTYIPFLDYMKDTVEKIYTLMPVRFQQSLLDPREYTHRLESGNSNSKIVE